MDAAQKVHSKLQSIASEASGDSSLVEHSQFGRRAVFRGGS
jgi:hypothetical protein